jgi:hypothetical protein
LDARPFQRRVRPGDGGAGHEAVLLNQLLRPGKEVGLVEGDFAHPAVQGQLAPTIQALLIDRHEPLARGDEQSLVRIYGCCLGLHRPSRKRSGRVDVLTRRD